MPIPIDHQLREQITHDASVFSITYFHDELATLPNWTGPLHWHHEFEIATAASGILDLQVGQKHITLEAGDSIFINGNIQDARHNCFWVLCRSCWCIRSFRNILPRDLYWAV